MQFLFLKFKNLKMISNQKLDRYLDYYMQYHILHPLHSETEHKRIAKTICGQGYSLGR